MLKGNAVINTITIIGIGAIGALMFSQVPGMMDDIKFILSKTSVIGKAAEIADRLTLVGASPSDIKIIYNLPEDVTYTVFIKDGYVNVSTDENWAVSKTLSNLCFKLDHADGECKPDTVKTLMIKRNSIEKLG